jgi:hypothetical protein
VTNEGVILLWRPRPGGREGKVIKPDCPWQNGKVERYNRTLATEWAYQQVYTSNDERPNRENLVGQTNGWKHTLNALTIHYGEHVTANA